MTERVIAGNTSDGQLMLFEVDELPKWSGLDPDTCGHETGTYRSKSEVGHCIWKPGDVPPENTEDEE